jgi:hypothetical protein
MFSSAASNGCGLLFVLEFEAAIPAAAFAAAGARASRLPKPLIPRKQSPLAQDVLALREGGSDDELAKEGLAYVLNHEVRSMHHPRFLRPLYNRQPPRR